MASQFENIHLLVSYLETLRYPASFRSLQKEFGWSRPTLFRALCAAEEAGHHIVNIRGNGYKLEAREENSPLPGFTPKELESLAVLWQMVENTQSEWVAQYSELRSALLARLRGMGIRLESWEGRIHYLPQHRRTTPAGVFRKVSHALLHRKALRFNYQTYHSEPELREVHPQQLVLYRNGWSLDALDLSRVGQRGVRDKGIRQFALDMITNVRESKAVWTEVPLTVLKKELAGGYGLFAGEADDVAILKFKGIAAFYVQREKWHSKQVMKKNMDGSIVLRIPFVSSHPDELLGDMLRWGEMAEVLGPDGLRERWKAKIQRMWEGIMD